MALIAGLSYSEALDSQPGLILDLYELKQRYDDQQHGIKRRRACEREA
jgi:hypothetical protein